MLATQTQSIIPVIAQVDFSQSHNSIHLVAALQAELEKLQAKVVTYYHDEIVLRGDKIMMREYCGYFGIEPTKQNL